VKCAPLVALVLAAAVAGCGSDDGERAVATVAGHKITREQLERTVEHFEEEAKREGHSFPDKGSAAYERIERQLRGLLVDRKELEVAAARLGVRVDDEEVERRLKASGTAEEEGGEDEEFLRETARAQLLTEAVFRKVTAGVRVTPAQIRAYYRTHRRRYGRTPFAHLRTAIRNELLAQLKNEAMARWRTQAHRSLASSVHYEKLED
jgi:hypothetical protein